MFSQDELINLQYLTWELHSVSTWKDNFKSADYSLSYICWGHQYLFVNSVKSTQFIYLLYGLLSI